MAKLTVVSIHFLLLFAQLILMPAWYILGIFIPFIRNRLFFELKRQEVDTLHADMAFEVSSQGELEQVFPIINHFLKSGAVIQVIYSSPSLNNEIEKLARDWKGQFFWLRMPIFTYFPLKTPLTSNVWSWLKATRLDFCRYDFFPELVLIAAKRSARLYSGTLKNKNIKGFMGFYFKGIYSLFDRIYCASPVDKGRFLELNQAQEVFFYDFRQIQILRRLEQKNITLNPLTMFINDVPKDSLLMMGSCWPNEMSVFADSNFRDELKSGKITLILAPHKLNTGFIDEIISSAKIHFLDFDPTIIQKNGEIIYGKQSNVIVTLLAGVLCEAYSLVKHTFVGGGHGRSVHSLLEPWLAGCVVYCGPKTHRSTEYDIIMKSRPDMLHVVEDPSELYQTFLDNKHDSKDMDMKNMRKQLDEQFQVILEELNVR